MVKKVNIIVWYATGMNCMESVWAWVVDGIAIHKAPFGNGWNLTHVNTGLAYATHLERDEIGEELKFYSGLSVAGAKFSDLPACEALTIQGTVAKRLGFEDESIEKWNYVVKPIADRLLHCENTPAPSPWDNDASAAELPY